MAVQILQKGTLPSERKYTHTCSNCRTKFSFTRGDARTSYDPRDGTLLVMTCPLPGCGREAYIDPRHHVVC